MILSTIKNRRHNLAYKSLSDWLHLDIPLISAILLLTIIGLTLIYSASEQNIFYTSRQLLHALLGFCTMLTIAQIHPNKINRYSPLIFYISITALILIPFIGITVNGAKRWIELGIFRFQPSELIKFSLPMFIAWYYTKKPFPISSSQIIYTCFMIIIPFVLISQQPDLATAIIILTSGIIVMFIGLTSWKFFASLSAMSVISAPILWHSLHHYQQARLKTLFDPTTDPLGSGYHIIQSKIAIGSGGISGQGWLNGTQSHLSFLPEDTTDFIFSVCAEEFGLIGCCIILALYLFVFLRSIHIVSKSQHYYGQLLSYSLISMFLINAIINIGMVTGIFPVVGLPLPFISYGGTSMITNCAIIGIILSVKSFKRK